MNTLMGVDKKCEVDLVVVKDKLEKKVSESKIVEKEVSKHEELTPLLRDVDLVFSVNDELNCVVIKVIDSETKDLIREIPTESMQKLKISLRRTMGLIFDETI